MDCHDCEEHHVAVQAQKDAPGEQLAGQISKYPSPNMIDSPGNQREGEDEVGHCQMEE